MANKSSTWIVSLAIFAILFVLGMVLAAGISMIAGKNNGFSAGNVALITVHGPIYVSGSDSIFSEPIASSDEIMKEIDEAVATPGIKAIIFDINSPGGSGVASYEVAEKILGLNVTTVAVIRDIGASGAYWIASACDHVVANPLSMTGSIGVIGSYLEFSGLMDKYNVTYERLVAGQYKDMGSPFRDMTDEERALFQTKLDIMREEFVKAVSANRNMSYAEVDRIADGSILLGSEAYDLGLVDSMGTERLAEEYLADLLGEDVTLARYEKQESLLSLLAGVNAGKDIGLSQGVAPERLFS
jgi:protease-4